MVMTRCLVLFRQRNKVSKRFITPHRKINMRKTKEHARFFALLEENISKPNVIKWHRPLVDLVTTTPKPQQQPKPFGVSLAQAFEQVEVKP